MKDSIWEQLIENLRGGHAHVTLEVMLLKSRGMFPAYAFTADLRKISTLLTCEF